MTDDDLTVPAEFRASMADFIDSAQRDSIDHPRSLRLLGEALACAPRWIAARLRPLVPLDALIPPPSAEDATGELFFSCEAVAELMDLPVEAIQQAAELHRAEMEGWTPDEIALIEHRGTAH